jgi:hypothetical protein
MPGGRRWARRNHGRYGRHKAPSILVPTSPGNGAGDGIYQSARRVQRIFALRESRTFARKNGTEGFRASTDSINDYSSVYSSDGTKIAFTSIRISGNNEVYTIGLNGIELTNITFVGSTLFDTHPVLDVVVDDEVEFVASEVVVFSQCAIYVIYKRFARSRNNGLDRQGIVTEAHLASFGVCPVERPSEHSLVH